LTYKTGNHEILIMRSIKKVIIKNTPGQKIIHPWIYKNRIISVEPGTDPGDIVRVFSSDNIFLGTGYYNPKSLIRIRMLSREDEIIDLEFLAKRISDAMKKRGDIKKISNAYRIIFSEADGLPGLILDMYNDTAVFQITTLGMDFLKQHVINAVREVIKPSYIYEKSDSTVRIAEGLKPVAGWQGNEGKEKIIIFEDNAKFIVNIVNGHKTGFYLDQRNVRIAAAKLAKGKTVLDLFCYAGAFSVHAALNGAAEVTGVDIKNEWLASLLENADLNNLSGKIICIKSNVFDILKKSLHENRQFDMIILDPPSFLKNRSSLKTALNGYLDLNRMAMKLLAENGILCTFSCSHHMRYDIFSDMIKQAALMERKKLQIIKRCHQDKDHPIIKEIPETEYLKGYFFSISSI
jgi:23S rRNA (cytosine1962-C5)-methyltransferase